MSIDATAMPSGLFVGLASLDLVYELDHLPAENRKGRSPALAVHAGGPAANAAATYAILGGRATLLTAIGDSSMGRQVRDEYTHLGVTVLDVAADSEALPCVASIALNPATGSRTIWGSPAPRARPIETSEIGPLVASAGFVMTDGYLSGLSLPIFEAARLAGIDTVVDGGSWKPGFEGLLALTDVLVSSADCRAPEPWKGTMNEVGLALGARETAITDGDRPIAWKTRTGEGRLAVDAVKALDTLGAGDVLHGAFCFFRYACGHSFVESLRQAASVASESVLHRGPRAGVQAFARRRGTA